MVAENEAAGVCAAGEPLRGLREELEPLRERFLRPGGELEVIVLAAPGEEERARTLAEALSA